MSNTLSEENKALLAYIQACNRASHIAALCIEQGFDTKSFNNGMTNQEMLQEAVAHNIISTGSLYVQKIVAHGKIAEMVDEASAKMVKEARINSKPVLSIVR